MSGHSKWSTIKHKKAASDSKRGQVFTKLTRAILVAAKEGGVDPDLNFKLRLAIDKAREVNMPKVNVDRALEKISGATGESWEELTYEGFGPGQVAMIVEAVTDNKNRTSAEIHQVFDKNGGHLGQPGSVAFMFKKMGLIEVVKSADADDQMLKIMDLNVVDVDADDEGVWVWVEPNKLKDFSQSLQAAGFQVILAQLVYRPVSSVPLDEQTEQKVTDFVAKLEDLDDVQHVFVNL